jgi:tRNA nucleotidyltransferase (CCA-adding enzyme)
MIRHLKFHKLKQFLISKKLKKMENNLSDLQKLHKLYEYEHKKPLVVFKEIHLQSWEVEIFDTIKKVLTKYDKKTICRVAGGWVRDKMLGKNTEDIDIALDDMKGEEIAKMINNELYQGHEKFGVVKENPEKSKHLETATMKIKEKFVDFVNLRSEKYTEHSRIPQIDIGTPEEDASRRDITINTMFYNIMTGHIEDWLKTGINDLEEGIIRTPLDPRITFEDDPLRILRVIRFAVRYQFYIDQSIEKAVIEGKEIKKALYKKISNERIAKELLQMLSGNKPNCAIYLLYKYNILDACLKMEHVDEIDLLASVNLCIILGYIIDNYGLHFQDVNTIYLSLLTLSLKKYSMKSGKETIDGSMYAIRESLKLKNEYVKDVHVVIENYGVMNNIVSNTYDRLTTSKFIRRVKSANLNNLVLASICTEYYSKTGATEVLESIDKDVLSEVIERHKNWEKYIDQENLRNVDAMKPLLDGISIQKEFQLEKGKIIGTLLEALIDEQIVNPNLTLETAKIFLYNKINNK